MHPRLCIEPPAQPDPGTIGASKLRADCVATRRHSRRVCDQTRVRLNQRTRTTLAVENPASRPRVVLRRPIENAPSVVQVDCFGCAVITTSFYILRQQEGPVRRAKVPLRFALNRYR